MPQRPRLQPMRPAHGSACGRAARARYALALGLGLLASALVAACSPQPRVPAPPMVQNAPSAPQAQGQRAPRPTPGAEARQAVAQADVVQAGREYVAALYAADDSAAAQYRSGFTDLLRKDENDLVLEGLQARPMTWGEAGYNDADPTLEWAEVVAQVRSRTGNTSGSVYYKLGFRREPEGLQLDLSARRIELR